MLRNLAIRWQILAALAVPLLVLAATGVQITRSAVRDMRRAQQALELSSFASSVSELVRGLSTERVLTVRSLTGSSIAPGELAQVRLANDARIARIRRDVEGSGLPVQYRRLLTSSAAGHAQLPDLRTGVDDGTMTAGQAAASYGRVIAGDVGLPAEIAVLVPESSMSNTFRRFGALSAAIDALSREQLTGLIVVDAPVGGLAALQTQRAFAADRAQQEQHLAEVVRGATPGQRAALSQVLSAPEARTQELDAERRAFDDAFSVLGRGPGSAQSWLDLTGSRLGVLNGVLDTIAAQGVATARAQVSSARVRAELTAAVATLLVLLVLLAALLMARRISQPLHRLTGAATRIRDELPELVAQLNAGGAAEIEMPPVPAAGGYEVSRLAAAFTDVNRVAVQVAREQAQLRSAVSEMFVNVARRNQVLLARQLAFIDQLERHEADPDALNDLFRLDHLATRMRRNAESLLVLAGIESGRRLRDAMLLSDVVRTATSEIEHYERISLALGTDPYVHAHAALPVAHLLAELLENATNFSDPSRAVVVMAAIGADGVRVTVADDGLGIPADDLAQINRRLSDPPAADVLGSQRLGFYVVGQLAQRLGVRVELTSGRSGGTSVLIDLPLTMFLDAPAPDHVIAWDEGPGGSPLMLTGLPEPQAISASAVQPEPEVQPMPGLTGSSLFSGFRSRVPAGPAVPKPRAEQTPAPPVPWESFAERDVLPARPVSLRAAFGLSRRRSTDQAGSDQAGTDQAGPAPLPKRIPATATPAVDVVPEAPPRRRYRDDGLPRPTQWPDAARPAPSDQAQAPPEPAPAAASAPVAQLDRSLIASQALSELSRLSAYTPAAVNTAGQAGLQRRTPSEVPPAAGPAATHHDRAAAPAGARARTAANVRAMLSGFTAGAERGRTSPAAHRPAAPGGGHG